MHKIMRLAVPLTVIVFSMGVTAPALAASPEETITCAVAPVTGGPNNPVIHTTHAEVNIPVNNPTIRWDGTLPGNVFAPAPRG
jgi:hypothetical protein